MRGELGHPRLLLRRDHELAGEPAEDHLPAVVEEGEPLVIALPAERHVGDDVFPPPAEDRLHGVERREIAAHLLHGDEIEAADDLGDVEEALGEPAAVFARVELADVPGREEQRLGDGAR